MISIYNTRYILGVFFSAIVISGCSASISEEDLALKRMLFGNWNSKNYESIAFDTENNFVDTLFSSAPYSNQQVVVPLYVIGGKYSVKQGLIFFEDAYFSYLRETADTSVKHYTINLYPRSIRFDHEKLFLQELSILESENPSAGLKGKWKTYNWCCMFERNSDNEFKGGIVEEILSFSDSADSAKFSSEYFFNTSFVPFTFYVSYEFNSNVIYINFKPVRHLDLPGTIAVMNDHKMNLFKTDPILFNRVNNKLQ